MILGKTKEEKGFVLIEALVSFSLASGLLIVTLPFLIAFFHVRESAKEQVEISRVLYEEALFWQRENDESNWLSGQDLYRVKTGRFSILVRGVEGNEKEVEIHSISREN